MNNATESRMRIANALERVSLRDIPPGWIRRG